VENEGLSLESNSRACKPRLLGGKLVRKEGAKKHIRSPKRVILALKNRKKKWFKSGFLSLVLSLSYF
jgi:hypothetical protein